MAAKESFAGKLAYSMMAGDNLLQFVAEEANGKLKERVDTKSSCTPIKLNGMLKAM